MPEAFLPILELIITCHFLYEILSWFFLDRLLPPSLSSHTHTHFYATIWQAVVKSLIYISVFPSEQKFLKGGDWVLILFNFFNPQSLAR